MRIERFSDLVEDDQKFYAANHHDRCPGIAHGDFFGDGTTTWVLLLITTTDSAENVRFVAAHQTTTGWNFIDVGHTGGPAPAVWPDKPGKYQDVYGEKTLEAKYPVFVVCGYEAWTIVYAWNGKEFDKVWLSD